MADDFQHRVLPPNAQALLKRAAATPDPYERQRAIERAIDYVRSMYPDFFKKEN